MQYNQMNFIFGTINIYCIYISFFFGGWGEGGGLNFREGIWNPDAVYTTMQNIYFSVGKKRAS